jgi:uncharacterized protein YeaO (DUF488 family)
MIQIYTTNYTKASRLSEKYYLKVSISLYRPKEFNGMQINSFAPTKELLSAFKNGLSEEEYEIRYRDQINKLSDIYSFFKIMAKQAKGRDILLLCYEKKNAFCHRHILSDIIYERYGYRIKEL